MAKFKQVPQTFILKSLLGFWTNMVKTIEEMSMMTISLISSAIASITIKR